MEQGLVAGGYILNAANLTVKKLNREVRLTPREFAVLEFLARHPAEIFKGDALMTRVWPADTEATTDTLRTIIKQIRKKLDDQSVIETVAGAGYVFGTDKKDTPDSL
jgi:two-component system response regulator VanR